MKTLLLNCQCHGHILRVEIDEHETSVTAWGPLYAEPRSRIREAWLILTGRRVPYAEVVLTTAQAAKLRGFLENPIGSRRP